MVLLLAAACGESATKTRSVSDVGTSDAPSSDQNCDPADTSCQERRTSATATSDTEEVFGPEVCHAQETTESCNAFRGHIIYPSTDASQPDRSWDRCQVLWLDTAGPEDTCFTRRERWICIPPGGGGEEVIWITLDDGESIAWLGSNYSDTIFPPGFAGVPALPAPPDFERKPLTDAQRTLLRTEEFCD